MNTTDYDLPPNFYTGKGNKTQEERDDELSRAEEEKSERKREDKEPSNAELLTESNQDNDY